MAVGVRWRGGHIYVVLREPDPHKPGKTKQVWYAGTIHGFHDEDTAIVWRDTRKLALKTKKAVARNTTSVSAFLARWLPEHVTTKDLKPTTAHSYAEKCKYVDSHPLGGMQLQAVTAPDIKAFYTDLLKRGLSRRTVEYVGTLLRLAFKSAVVEYRLIETSPAANVQIPRPRAKAMTTWTAEQAKTLLDVLSQDRYGRLFVVQAATGARRGELLALSWDDVDLTGRWIRFTKNRVRVPGGYTEHSLKNGMPKQLRIDAPLVALLKEHRKEQKADQLRAGERWCPLGYVFANVIGGPLMANNLNRYWQAAIAEAGVPYLKPHSLRHMHATVLLEAGVSPHVVAERLGHKDVTTTLKVYAHVTNKQQDDAADAFTSWISQ